MDYPLSKWEIRHTLEKRWLQARKCIAFQFQQVDTSIDISIARNTGRLSKKIEPCCFHQQAQYHHHIIFEVTAQMLHKTF